VARSQGVQQHRYRARADDVVLRARRDHDRRSLTNLGANTMQHGGAAALLYAKELVELVHRLTDIPLHSR